ncbi:MAG: trehalose-phosphatase [Actinomycetota bacterium]
MIDPALREALRAAAAAPVLLVASDYDGTLSPIVGDPAAAVPHEPALTALIEVCDLPDVHGMIISGRSLDVLAQLTGAPQSITLIGSHGAQASGSSPAGPEQERTIADLNDALERVARSHEGAVLESKPSGAALHYRHSADPTAVLSAVEGIAARSDARVIEGKKVVEFVVGEGDKGTAVDHHRHVVEADRVVFFGDDVTDEDVFAVLGPVDIGVKVGSEPSLAQFRVDDPEGVADALRLLVSERRPLSR